MNAFLYGPFRAITTDFGRPPVRSWVGAAFARGAQFGGVPVFATRELRALPPDGSPGEVVEAEAAALPGGEWHSTALAVDPLRWEVVRYVLWTHVPDAWSPAAVPFEVLHASTPQLEQLPTGRLW